MSSRTELAARKQLLLARSALYRAALHHHALSLRHAIATPKSVLAFAALPGVRSALFSALLLVAGRGRLGRWLRGAIGIIAAAKVAQAFFTRRDPGRARPGDGVR